MVEVIHIRETALLKVNNFRTMVKLIASLRVAVVNPTMAAAVELQKNKTNRKTFVTRTLSFSLVDCEDFY